MVVAQPSCSKTSNVGSNTAIAVPKTTNIDPKTMHKDSNANSAQTSLTDKPTQYVKILGHLNYVFCVCFDRTGQFIFTVIYF